MTDTRSEDHASIGKQSMDMITTGRTLAGAALSLSRSLVASRAPAGDPGARTCGRPRSCCTDHVNEYESEHEIVQRTEGNACSKADADAASKDGCNSRAKWYVA